MPLFAPFSEIEDPVKACVQLTIESTLAILVCALCLWCLSSRSRKCCICITVSTGCLIRF